MRMQRDAEAVARQRRARGRRTLAWCAVLTLAAAAASDRLAAQVTFETTVADLASPDLQTRLRAVALLKTAGYPEAALPVAALIGAPEDELQLEAIAAELNFFLAQKIVPKRRVAGVVEVRERVEAEPTFTAGPVVLAEDRVPVPVVSALLAAALDRTPRVAVEALYAFGTLAGEVPVEERARVLAETAPTLAGLIGSTSPMLRLAAVRVAGRVYSWRPTDPPVDQVIGDAVIAALNDREDPVRETAMWALGSMRYERSVQALTDLFAFYKKGPLATRAFEALARIAHEGSAPQFVEQLAGRTAALKLAAIEGLARIGDRRQAEPIQAAVQADRSEAMILAMQFANVALAGGSADSIVEALARDRLRAQAFRYVVELAPGRMAALARYVADPDRRMRLELVNALGLSGETAAVPHLVPLGRDADAEVAFAARRAMARLGGAPAVQQ